MKKPDTAKYDTAYKSFETALSNFINKLSTKLKNLTIKTKTFNTSNTTLDLVDNTVYQYTGTSGVSTLTIKYPEGDFIATILFSTTNSGTINVIFPEGTKFVGHRKLEFFNQEHWELNIHNKRVVAVQIFE